MQIASETIVYNYPSQPVMTGSSREVRVVKGNPPCDFYCQLTDNLCLLSGLMEKMNATYYAGHLS